MWTRFKPGAVDHPAQHEELSETVVFGMLEGAAASSSWAAKFSAIRVNGDSFQGTTRSPNQLFTIDLQQIGTIRVRKFSAANTALAALRVTIAIIVLVNSCPPGELCFG